MITLLDKINLALNAEMRGRVRFIISNDGNGVLRFERDDPTQGQVDQAIAIVNRFAGWQPDSRLVNNAR